MADIEFQQNLKNRMAVMANFLEIYIYVCDVEKLNGYKTFLNGSHYELGVTTLQPLFN